MLDASVGHVDLVLFATLHLACLPRAHFGPGVAGGQGLRRVDALRFRVGARLVGLLCRAVVDDVDLVADHDAGVRIRVQLLARDASNMRGAARIKRAIGQLIAFALLRLLARVGGDG